MKILLLATAILCGTITHAQPAPKYQPGWYISVQDSTPEYANICAVLLRGKEFNIRVGAQCPVLAQYIFQVGWVAADRKPWKTPQISHKRLRKLDVSYWYPLPIITNNLPVYGNP